MQDEMGRFVERVVVAVAEGESGRAETAGAVADEIDDRGEFAGHDETVCRKVAQYKAVRAANPAADVRARKPPYNSRMNRLRSSGRVSATTLILIVAVAAALGLWFGTRMFGTAAPPRLEAAVLYPAPRALPAFQLTRSNGEALTLADWKGHWTVAFFGYTNCPDVCPTTLAAFKQVWKLLDAAGVASTMRFDFISVDPARDTPGTTRPLRRFLQQGLHRRDRQRRGTDPADPRAGPDLLDREIRPTATTRSTTAQPP